MAQRGRLSSGQVKPKTSPAPVFPVFENYLKMIRFSSDETELLEKCLIPVENEQYLRKPSTNIKRTDYDLADSVDLPTIDDDFFWKIFNSDGHIDNMSTNLSQMSMKQTITRKKKRSERWQGSSGSGSDKGTSSSRHSSSAGDINARRVSSDGYINHKTVLTQHVPSDTTVPDKEGISDSRAEQTPKAVDSDEKRRHRRRHARHADRHDDRPRSSKSKHSSEERHDYSSKHHKNNQSRSGKSKHSSQGGSGYDNDRQKSNDDEFTDNNPSDFDGKRYRSRRHKHHHEKQLVLESQTPITRDKDEVGPSPSRSWSSRMEHNSSDSGTHDSELTNKRRRRPKRSDAVSICSTEEEENDKKLGRNMRAIARRSGRKLRT